MKRSKNIYCAFALVLIALVVYAVWKADSHRIPTALPSHQQSLGESSSALIAKSHEIARGEEFANATRKSNDKGNLKNVPLGSLPALAAPLAAQIAELERLAKSGDAVAALNLWHGLHQCESVISQSESHFLKHGNPSTVKMFEQQISDLLDNCRDVTAEQMSGQYKWLRLSAELGNAQAQYFYSQAGTDAVGGIDEALRNPAEWQEYQTVAKTYLENLLRQCSSDAIGAMAYAYEDGDRLFSRDLLKSYEYQLVSLRIHPATTSAIRSAVLARYSGMISADQIAMATRQADEFFAQFCQ